MSYCKMYDKKENELPFWYCCLNECREHEFCKCCKVTNNQVVK